MTDPDKPDPSIIANDPSAAASNKATIEALLRDRQPVQLPAGDVYVGGRIGDGAPVNSDITIGNRDPFTALATVIDTDPADQTWTVFTIGPPAPAPELPPVRPGAHRYFIDGVFTPSIALDIEGVPPCFSCGVPVVRPSMGGPLVCGPCDMGRTAAGARKTNEDYAAGAKHWQAMIAKYRVMPPGEEK